MKGPFVTMRTPRISRRDVLILAGTSALLSVRAAVAFAESTGGVALLVGMDEYPFLDQFTKNLRGAGTNSVEILAAALKDGYGYADDNIIRLLNPKKQQFLDSVRRYHQPSKPFIVYFLGHGSRNQATEGLLLFRDSVENPSNSFSGDLTRSELNAILWEVADQGAAVTCLLDSCTSWSMASKSLSANIMPDPEHPPIPLFYHRPIKGENISKEILQIKRDDDGSSRGGRISPITNIPCFFTACDVGEDAYLGWIRDGDNAGKYVGLFTNALALALQKELPHNATWSQVYESVAHRTASLAAKMDVSTPHPRLTPEFNELVVFSPLSGVFDPANPSTIDRFFTAHFENDSALHVEVMPCQREVDLEHIQVNDQFTIEIDVKRTGYLLLIEQTPKRELRLHYPTDLSLQGARAEGGNISLPLPQRNQRFAFYHDAPGTDTVKAFLFPESSKDQVQEILDHFRVHPRFSADQAKDIRLTALPPEPNEKTPLSLVTAEHTFFVRAAGSVHS